MFIEGMSYTPVMLDGLRQTIMIYSALLESARKETRSEAEAYKITDHVFIDLLTSQQDNKKG